MTMISFNSKKLCISLFAIVGSTFLFSCNKGGSDKKPNSELASNGQNPSNPTTGDNVTDEGTSEEAQSEESVPKDGISSISISLTGNSSTDMSSDDSSEGSDVLSDKSKSILNNDDSEEEVTIQPDYFEVESENDLNESLVEAQLDNYQDLQLKLTPVCDENKLFNNKKHNIPVRVSLSYNDSGNRVELSDEVVRSIKRNINFSNYIDKKKAPEKLDNVMFSRNNFTKCFGQDNVNLDADDLVYISSDKEINLIASLDYKKEAGGVLKSIPLENVKKKDLFKIEILKNPKLDVFSDSTHLLKAENNSNVKVKIVKVTENKKLKNYKPFVLKSIAMSLSGNKNNVEIYNTNSENNNFEKLRSITYPSLTNHRVISDFTFINQGETKLNLDKIVTGLNDENFLFKDSKNTLDLEAAKSKLPAFSENEFGFIIRVSDSQKTGLKANLEFKGEDAYGNEFTSSLNGEKW
ncbi:hypothetical protein GCL60_17060 [Silvanigrella paludirubra]|uniref:Lipoprotein n=1 Tax=Silvanigrella paludirubra TaxID=2499159 RepID=A0A6N6VNZ1_9BACT|nr:hypothetical protein [Silvanigrella paludirubra]KAB8035607.1 hypothetical protein GCL60_17060 [Silvanigrella paludirubra]